MEKKRKKQKERKAGRGRKTVMGGSEQRFCDPSSKTLRS